MNDNYKNDERLNALKRWLKKDFDEDVCDLTVVAGDASFRRYFRLKPKRVANIAKAASWIIMDAPPEKENCRSFLQVLKKLEESGLRVPTLIAKNLDEGFLAIADFGKNTFLAVVRKNPKAADVLYRAALKEIVTMQRQTATSDLPVFDRERLMAELQMFADWYLKKHLSLDFDKEVLLKMFDVILQENLSQPTAFVHRDYHSGNLMVLNDDFNAKKEPQIGLLDFQDALLGPLTYDVVSLLRDAYEDIPEKVELDWLIRYWQQARLASLPLSSDFAIFFRQYEWMGLQRHIKILGIFARLYHRDGKSSYLQYMPRVFAYAYKVSRRYRELAPFSRLLESIEKNVGAK